MISMNSFAASLTRMGLTMPALALGLTMASAVGGCELDRRVTGGPSDGGGGEGGMTVTDGGGGMGGDGGVGGEGGMGGGLLIAGSQYVPAPLRPTDAATLPPTRAFLLWQNAELPTGRTVQGYEVCSTIGPATDIDEVSECPNSTVLANLFQVLDPLTPNMTYRWKIRARYDGGDYSEWSAVRVFSSDASLLAWWRFNEGAGNSTVDSSGFMNNATLHNGPVWVAGRDGSALQLDGNNDYLSVGDQSSLEGMSRLTLEAWIRTTSSVLNRPIISKWFTGTESYVLRLSPAIAGAVGFSTYTSAPIDANGATVINDGNWHHVMGVYDGAIQRVIVDLIEDGSAPQSGAIANSEEEVSFGDYMNGTPQGFNFTGALDEVAIYNRDLTADQRTNSYCATQAHGGLDPLPAVCLP